MRLISAVFRSTSWTQCCHAAFSARTGSLFCLVSDLIARTAFAPTELTISTVTSVLGAPVVIWLMIKRRRSS